MRKIVAILLGVAMSISILGTALAAEPDYRSGTPWPDIDLDGVVTEDMNASLKDNFVLAVNKDKILALEIPEGYACGGTLTNLKVKVNKDMKNMFLGTAPEGHDSMLAYNLFHLMMDWESRNAQGVAPLKKVTDELEAINSIEGLNNYFLQTPLEDLQALLWVAASAPDVTDSTHHVLTVGCMPLLLDDSAEYSKLTDYGKIKKEAASGLLQKMLVKLGYTEKNARQKIDNCLFLETKLAPAIYTNEEQNLPDYMARTNNRYSKEQLAREQGNVPILGMLAKSGYPEEKEYVVQSPQLLAKLNEVYTQKNLPLLKDYLIVHAVMDCAEILDRECYEWHYAYKNAISGASGMLPDEEAFSVSVAEKLEWPVARFYSETYLKESDKERIAKLVDKIFSAYHGVINEADFLSAATKANAIEKLEAIDSRVLYPDSWEKYECKELDITSPQEGGTLWQAMKNINGYIITKNVKEHSEPIDRSLWCMTPQTVNCAYEPTTNAVHIAGAFAQDAMYSSDMSDEELMAKLGWVIGHEISHAFDSTGAQFDKDGNMKNWWTEEDYAKFRARNDKMVAYYNNMHPWAGQDFYGSIMTGEAGADMAGLKAVLRIAAENKDFDYDKFFHAFTEPWLIKDTLQNAYARINDVHPMGYLRINCTLQQYDEFLNFYGITEGDGMYLAPNDRVTIW